MIVVAGEAPIDLIVGPDGALVATPGGGPYNTARTTARLAQPVTFLGRTSTDRFGRDLRTNLARDGVDVDGVIETDDPTTLAVAELDEDGVAEYHFYADGTSAPGLTDADAASVMDAFVAAVHVETLGLVLEPIGPTIERLVRESDPGRLVVVDPNCRRTATPDPVAFRARIERIARRADVVKVSDDDLRFLAPGDDPDSIIDRLLALGLRVVLRTHGGDSVEVWTPSGRATVSVPAVDVIDTDGQHPRSRSWADRARPGRNTDRHASRGGCDEARRPAHPARHTGGSGGGAAPGPAIPFTRSGITAWQDAWVDAPNLAAYRAVAADGRLTARVIAALWWDRDRSGEQIDEFEEQRAWAAVGRLRPTTVKIMQDGVAENYTAAMLEPYLDREGRPTPNPGKSFVDAEELKRHVTRLDALGLQVHIHAIGDRGVREALDAFEAARRANRPPTDATTSPTCRSSTRPTSHASGSWA